MDIHEGSLLCPVFHDQSNLSALEVVHVKFVGNEQCLATHSKPYTIGDISYEETDVNSTIKLMNLIATSIKE